MSRTTLNNSADTIRDETASNANTATRVGTMFSDLIEDTNLLSERIQNQIHFVGSQLITISAVDTPTKVTFPSVENGITELGSDYASNQFTFSQAGTVFATATIVTTGALSSRFEWSFYKNGTKVDASVGISRTSAPGASDTRQVIIQSLVSVEVDDYLEIFAENLTDDENITITNLTAIIKS